MHDQAQVGMNGWIGGMPWVRIGICLPVFVLIVVVFDNQLKK